MSPETLLFEKTTTSSVAPPLVCVIDDEEPIRQSLGRLFRAVRLPVRAFASAAEFLAHPAHQGPCCVVLDVRMPEADGFALQQLLTGRGAQIVFLTGHGDVAMCSRAMRAGAVDFLTKPVDDEILLEAAARALGRSRQLLATLAASAAARAKIDRLTPRETAVMRRVIRGMLNKQIAAELGAAEKTIKVHRGRMMRKTGVVSVPELVRLALLAGVAEPVHPTLAS